VRVLCVPRVRVGLCSLQYLRTMKLPEAIHRKRKRLYTASELAGVLGVSKSTVERIERDCDSVHPRVLRAYLALLGWRVRISPKDRRTQEEG